MEPWQKRVLLDKSNTFFKSFKMVFPFFPILSIFQFFIDLTINSSVFNFIKNFKESDPVDAEFMKEWDVTFDQQKFIFENRYCSW